MRLLPPAVCGRLFWKAYLECLDGEENVEGRVREDDAGRLCRRLLVLLLVLLLLSVPEPLPCIARCARRRSAVPRVQLM